MSEDSRGKRERVSLAGRLALEFGIVVFGVFIALWADARVTARGESRLEATRLQALGSDVALARDSLDAYLAAVGEEIEMLSTWLDGRAVAGISDDDLRSLIAVGLLGGLSSFDPQIDALDDLRFSGELSLLEDDARRAASALDASLRRLGDAQDDLMAVQHLNFDPYALARIDLTTLLEASSTDGSALAEWRAVATSREFRNIMTFRVDLLTQILHAATRLASDLEAAEAAIAARLDELGMPGRPAAHRP